MCGKLPDWLSNRWARQVHRSREVTKCFPTFLDFVTFLTREADIACDPIVSTHCKLQPTNKIDKAQTQCTGKSLNTIRGSKCSFCDQVNHTIDKCFKFKAIPITDREAFVKEKGLCFGCLNKGHLSKECKQRLKCSVCSSKHPTPFHGNAKYKGSSNSNQEIPRGHNPHSKPEREIPPSTSSAPVTNSDSNSVVTSSHTSHFINDINVSKSTMVVPVYLSHESDPCREILTYALLDTQSDTTFVTESVASQLGISGVDTTLCLTTMTSENSIVRCKRLSGLRARCHSGGSFVQLPPSFTRECIPAEHRNIPVPEMADRWPYLRPMISKLMPKSSCGIGLLIGYNCPKALTPREVIPPIGDGPFAQRTDLGWGIIGLIGEDASIESEQAQHVCSQTGSRIVLRTTSKELVSPLDVLKFFAREEGCVIDKALSQDDVKFMKIMQSGVTKVDGHYQMPLPFRNPNPTIESNKVLAIQRLRGLVRRFKRDDEYFQHYVVCMKDVISSGYAEPVPLNEIDGDGTCYYLPHHGVCNPNKPGKVRVVMDASAKHKGLSLNDYLVTGPDLMNSLVGVLCRFREERIAVTCDIKGMFHQFKVDPSHRNYLRFLWFKDHDYRQEIVEYRSTVHLFGLASSPAVANFGLKKAATDNEALFGSDVAEFIHHNFYVDDGLISLPSEEAAVSLIDRSIKLCASSGLTLHKFMSNSSHVLESFDEFQSDTQKDIDFGEGRLPLQRALGVRWCVESDTFKFRVTVKEHVFTRRGVLSTVCSIFDPLGMIAPVVLQGKIILQQMCRDHLDWDEPIPEHLYAPWEKWLSNLPSLENISVERCVKSHDRPQVHRFELHHFSDGSKLAFGQCSYLRLVFVDGSVECRLLMAKSRVAPLRTTTIPRLELSGAVLSAAVSQMLESELGYPNVTHRFYTDSKIVLGFISNDSKRFHVYVSNRVQQIRDVSEPSQWSYVHTSQNPSDAASRGCTAAELVDSTWFSGPEFLYEPHLQLLAKIGSDHRCISRSRRVRTQGQG